MRVILQRVRSANVRIDGEVVGQIQQGFLLLVGIATDDTNEDVKKIADKISKLRVFEDEHGKMNLNIDQVNGQILSVSQFTLYADVKKGNRPGFTNAADPKIAKPLYDQFNDALRNNNLHVETGRFGADMQVHLENDGPVTIIYDTQEL